ncbi:MAG: DUF4198 domain-containing protein, partial [Gemmatimonadales bacterium]
MIRRCALVAVCLLALASTVSAHDMFLKLRAYFLRPSSSVSVPLLNGTFTTSENSIDRHRIADISVAGPAGRERFDTTVVTARADSTFFALKTGPEGTYAFGVSTRPNVIGMTGHEFHEYLREEGLDWLIVAREKAGIAADSAREQYAKHVKAVVQVGEARSKSFGTLLGYSAELVPLDNPYEWKRGNTLRFRALVNGTPAPRLTVISGGRTPTGGRLARRPVMTDDAGVVTLRPTGPGVWYLTFIHI